MKCVIKIIAITIIYLIARLIADVCISGWIAGTIAYGMCETIDTMMED